MSFWELVKLEVSILPILVTGLGRSIITVSERYDSSDRKIAGDGKCPKNNQEDDLDGFLEGFGPKISPLDMLQMAVQNGFIQSFKPTSTNEIYEKLGKGICEICDEHLMRIMNVVTMALMAFDPEHSPPTLH